VAVGSWKGEESRWRHSAVDAALRLHALSVALSSGGGLRRRRRAEDARGCPAAKYD